MNSKEFPEGEDMILSVREEGSLWAKEETGLRVVREEAGSQEEAGGHREG